MKNKLHENMRRFGTKNLNEAPVTDPIRIGGVSGGKFWHGKWIYKLEVEYALMMHTLTITDVDTFGGGVIVYGTKMGYSTWIGITTAQWNGIMREINKGTTPITVTLDTTGASNSSTTTNAWTGKGGAKDKFDIRLTRTN